MKNISVIMIILTLGALFTLGSAADDKSAGRDEGQILYNKKCAICHSKSGKAKKSAKGSGDFNDPGWQAAATLDQIVKDTTEGKGKMMGYGRKFTPEQIEMIAVYVKSLGSASADGFTGEKQGFFLRLIPYGQKSLVHSQENRGPDNSQTERTSLSQVFIVG